MPPYWKLISPHGKLHVFKILPQNMEFLNFYLCSGAKAQHYATCSTKLTQVELPCIAMHDKDIKWMSLMFLVHTKKGMVKFSYHMAEPLSH